MQIRTTNPAATVGTAVHEVLGEVVEGRAVDADVVAAKHGCDPGEVGMLARFGRKAWDEIKASFPNAMSEVPLQFELPMLLLTGHVDALSVAGGVVHLLDWKTGRVDHSYEQQIKGYLALALSAYPEAERAVGVVVWLREQEIERYEMNRTGAMLWFRSLGETVGAIDGPYHPGRACDYCPRSHECDALLALAKRDARAVAATMPDLAGADLLAALAGAVDMMDPAAMARLLAQASRISRFADSFRQVVRARVAALGGDVDAGDVRLVLAEEKRRELDTAAAWPIVQEALGDDGALASCVTVSLSAVEKAVATAAGRGKGKAAKEALAAQLEAAGAVKVKTITKLKEMRK